MMINRLLIVFQLLFVISILAQNSNEHVFKNRIDTYKLDEIPSLFELKKSECFSTVTPNIPEIHFNKTLSTRQFYHKESFTGQFILYETQGDGAFLKHQTYDYFSLPFDCGLAAPQGGASSGDFGGAILHALLREFDIGFKLGRHTITFF